MWRGVNRNEKKNSVCDGRNGKEEKGVGRKMWHGNIYWMGGARGYEVRGMLEGRCGWEEFSW